MGRWHIDRARSDRDQHAVHLTLLAEAGRSHAADLRWALQYLRAQVLGDLERGDKADQARFAALLKGAKQHLIRQPLWKQHAEWEQLTGHVVAGEQAVQDAITQVVKERVAELPPVLDLNGWHEGLWQAARSLTLPQHKLSVSTLLLAKHYEQEQTPGGWVLNWEGRRLTQGLADAPRLGEIERAHAAAARQISNLPVLKDYANACRRMEAVRATVDTMVQELLLRHLLPGHCALCPG